MYCRKILFVISIIIGLLWLVVCGPLLFGYIIQTQHLCQFPFCYLLGALFNFIFTFLTSGLIVMIIHICMMIYTPNYRLDDLQ